MRRQSGKGIKAARHHIKQRRKLSFSGLAIGTPFKPDLATFQRREPSICGLDFIIAKQNFLIIDN
jgi:hypothetical protein